MTKVELQSALKELPPGIRFAFAPLIKRAVGLAVGGTLGVWIFAFTLYHKILAPDLSQYDFAPGLLGQYFAGYDPESWSGPFVGLLWGLWTGFVMGWFFAAFRNFLVAIWVFVIRTKANLAANREFLDHI